MIFVTEFVVSDKNHPVNEVSKNDFTVIFRPKIIILVTYSRLRVKRMVYALDTVHISLTHAYLGIQD